MPEELTPSSSPTPLSPEISTLTSLSATRSTIVMTSRIGEAERRKPRSRRLVRNLHLGLCPDETIRPVSSITSRLTRQ
jgi:hypothetical protein